ncbi:hypothetical protein [Paenibacillus radicis (ex Xue et al. 2023)]|uniref:XRE family transcriptional regulator n=1 Tax=Paenibacillus radicis (ex Xue et al. 2023) TaxID=2972489 RepID=A0ABT1YHD4_9BACL|nr:hypothetical protein [Paenibacillus radicis (ex Xue et al. 2023)]MCR8631365.1 hypothetical protein [Paenibacillus radicis (ex Xue et al. 2023)]
MERTKTSLDIRLILKQLNIPIEKYEQWNRMDHTSKTEPLSLQYPDAWNSTEPSLRRQKA